jgi:hypothetical protein
MFSAVYHPQLKHGRHQMGAAACMRHSIKVISRTLLRRDFQRNQVLNLLAISEVANKEIFTFERLGGGGGANPKPKTCRWLGGAVCARVGKLSQAP